MFRKASNNLAKVRSLEKQHRAFKLITEGLSRTEVAQALGITTKTVETYVNAMLKTGSSFPTDLTADAVNRQRQIQSEILLNAMATVIRHMDEVDKDAELSADDKLHASANGLKALSMATGRLAAMNALNAPIQVREESMRLSVTKIDQQIKVSFDRAQLKPDWSVYTGGRIVPPDEPCEPSEACLPAGTSNASPTSSQTPGTSPTSS